jgi:hypothetical protein
LPPSAFPACHRAVSLMATNPEMKNNQSAATVRRSRVYFVMAVHANDWRMLGMV